MPPKLTEDVDHEFRVTQALLGVENGESANAMAKKWKISASTISRRRHGSSRRLAAWQDYQLLTSTEEDGLRDWILSEERAGRPPTKVEISGFAALILDSRGSSRIPGKNWVNRFLRRHDALKIKYTDLLSRDRAEATSEDNLRQFYRFLDRQIRDKAVPPQFITNIDEHGLREGHQRGKKVAGSSLTRRAYTSGSDATSWVSIIQAIQADGSRLTPVVIFTGESLQEQWFPDEIRPWYYCCSTTGWSNSELALEWLDLVYLPETKPHDPNQWRILLLDGHVTHTSPEFMYKCWQNRVQCVYLPAHTSHKTQPLDVGCFSPIKTYFDEAIRQFPTSKATSPAQKQRFLLAYYEAYTRAFTPRTCRNAFKGAGCWPVDASKALETNDLPIDADQPPEAPATPPRTHHNDPQVVWTTPRSSQDLKRQAKALDEAYKLSHIGLRRMVQKVGKAIDEEAVRTAALREQVRYIEHGLDGLKPTKRRKVVSDPNKLFASQSDVLNTREGLAPSEAKKRRKTATKRAPRAKKNASGPSSTTVGNSITVVHA
jgi:hypothetical protein